MQIKICGRRTTQEKDSFGIPTGVAFLFTRETEDLSEGNFEGAKLCLVENNKRSQNFEMHICIDKIMFLLIMLLIIICDGEKIAVAIDSMAHQKADYKMMGIDMSMSFRLNYIVDQKIILDGDKDRRFDLFVKELYIEISESL
jgi:hypothetical protein